jgi:hypothetical protein
LIEGNDHSVRAPEAKRVAVEATSQFQAAAVRDPRTFGAAEGNSRHDALLRAPARQEADGRVARRDGLRTVHRLLEFDRFDEGREDHRHASLDPAEATQAGGREGDGHGAAPDAFARPVEGKAAPPRFPVDLLIEEIPLLIPKLRDLEIVNCRAGNPDSTDGRWAAR